MGWAELGLYEMAPVAFVSAAAADELSDSFDINAHWAGGAARNFIAIS